MSTMMRALLLFAAMYVLLLIFENHRWLIALGAAVLFVLTGYFRLETPSGQSTGTFC